MTADLPGFARTIGFDVADLPLIPLSYRVHQIPKNAGGVRTLQIPNTVLRSVQRTILRRVLYKLPVHPKAIGFRPNFSVVDHAKLHIRQAVVIKIDIRDFFPNTTAKSFAEFLMAWGYPCEVADWLLRLCTYADGLPQGAPTSPCISNVVNSELDARLDGLAKWYGGNYSRYADDITFSFDEYHRRFVFEIFYLTNCILADYGYVVNDQKLRVLRGYRRQCVTGLVVNEKVALPRRLRRNLRAAVHHRKHGRPLTDVAGKPSPGEACPAPMTPRQLAGWLAYAQMVATQSQKPHP